MNILALGVLALCQSLLWDQDHLLIRKSQANLWESLNVFSLPDFNFGFPVATTEGSFSLIVIMAFSWENLRLLLLLLPLFFFMGQRLLRNATLSLILTV
jgi:hypothetical protein